MNRVTIKPRDVMPPTAFTLPARYYTDASLFHRELDDLFGRMWFSAGRSEEASRSDQYVVRELNGRNIVVTRNERVRAKCGVRPRLFEARREGTCRGSDP